MPDNSYTSDLSNAVLHTLVYSDIFDYPLTADEIHHYLTGIPASLDETIRVLKANGRVVQIGDYFTLFGREELVEVRRQREARSKKLLPIALNYGRILGLLPFVRMVALTGSLAVMNISKNADFDYMLVVAPRRIWTARAFGLLFNRITRLFGHTLCPNLVVAETALEWPLHDLYSARELCQMIPITGMDVYQRLMIANDWAKEFLPNAFLELGSLLPKLQKQASALQNVLELPLRGKLGDRLERWEMNRKIARFSKQAGFGEETVFNADVCQGNFHHHRKWTSEAFEEKLSALAAVRGGDMTVMESSGTAIGAGIL